VIFYGAVAFSALQSKDYGVAHDYYAKALAINSDNLADVYQAGIVELSQTPPDVTGFWHIAKAAASPSRGKILRPSSRSRTTDGDNMPITTEAARDGTSLRPRS